MVFGSGRTASTMNTVGSTVPGTRSHGIARPGTPVAPESTSLTLMSTGAIRVPTRLPVSR